MSRRRSIRATPSGSPASGSGRIRAWCIDHDAAHGVPSQSNNRPEPDIARYIRIPDLIQSCAIRAREHDEEGQMRWMRFGRTQSETRAGRRVRPAAGSLVVGGVCALLVAILALGAASASAEPLCEDTWTGPAEGEWTTEADWSSGKVPTSASVACIGSGKTVTVRFSGSVAGVVQGEGSVVISGGSLEVASALEPSAIAHLSVTGGELVGSGEVNVTHSFSGGGGEAKLAGSGPVVIESGATGTVSSSLRLNNVTLKNAGTLSVGAEAEEGASIDGEGHAVLTNSGTLIANTAANAFAKFSGI